MIRASSCLLLQTTSVGFGTSKATKSGTMVDITPGRFALCVFQLKRYSPKEQVLHACSVVRGLPEKLAREFFMLDGFKHLTDTFNKYPEDAEIIEQACLGLAQLAETCAPTVPGCVEAILGVAQRFMSTYSAEKYVCTVQAAFKALVRITSNNSTNKEAFFAKYGQDVCVQALLTYPKHFWSIHRAAGFLIGLLINVGDRHCYDRPFNEVDNVFPAIHIASFDTPNKVLQKSFANKLVYLGDRDRDIKLWIDDLKASNVEEVCENIRLLSYEGVAYFGELGGFAHLVDNLGKYPDDTELAKCVCLAIWHCAFHKCAKARSGQDGCVKAVLDVARRFMPNWLDTSVSENVRVETACTVQAAFRALVNMTFGNTENKNKFVGNNGVDICFQALKTYSSSFPAFLVPPCMALHSIIEHAGTTVQQVDQVTMLISEFSKQPELDSLDRSVAQDVLVTELHALHSRILFK
jgi:hypothetical protein